MQELGELENNLGSIEKLENAWTFVELEVSRREGLEVVGRPEESRKLAELGNLWVEGLRR